MAFVAHLGHDLRDFRYKDTKFILIAGSIAYIICCVVLSLNYLGNIADCAAAAIPNLVLANRFISGMAVIFSVIIMLSIYSTMCPILWTCASTIWSNESSLPYRAFIILCGIVVYLVTLFVPYATLLNYIMTYWGYTGAFSGIVIVIRFFMLRSQDKRAAQQSAV